MSGYGQFCRRVVEAGWLIALAAIPLYFNVFSSRVFEPDKTIILRCLVLVMLAAAAIASVEGRGELSPCFSLRSAVASIARSLRPKNNPLALPVVIFLGVEIMSTLVSIEPFTSLFGSYQRLQGTYTLATYIAFFFLVTTHLHTADQVNRAIRVALLTTVPICLYGVAQHLGLDPLPWGGDVVSRVTSTMGNAIFLAAYLIMVIPLTGARLVAAISRGRNRSLPDRVAGDGGHAALWVVIVVVQNVLLLIPLVGQISEAQVWWAATAFIGVFLLLATIPAAVALSRASAKAEATALAALLVLQIGCLVLTQSRGPWLGLLVGAATFALLLQLSSQFDRRRVAALLASMILLAIALVVFNLPESPLARFRSVPYVGRLGQLTDVSEGTGRVRVLIWQGTIELLTTHPSIGFSPDPLSALRPLIGYGPETMHVAFNRVYPPALGDLESRNASPDRNHNDLLDHLVMTGVVGLLGYLFVVVATLRLGWTIVRSATTPGARLLLVGLLAALVAHLAETQTGIAVVATKTYFWMILGVLAAVSVRPNLATPAESATSTARQPVAIPPANPSSKARRTARPSQGMSVEANSTVPTSDLIGVVARYVVVVAVAQTVLLVVSSAGIGGAPLLEYGSFLWLLLAATAFATIRGPERIGPSFTSSAIPATVLALVIVGGLSLYNLNRLAADVYHKQGTGLDARQRYLESAESYRAALALSPGQAFYALYLGRAYLNLAQQSSTPTQTSNRTVTLASVLSSTPGQATDLTRTDAFESSRVVLEYARAIEPLNPDHYLNLARLYHVWGLPNDQTKLQTSARYSEIAAVLSPHSAQLYDEWALTLLDLSQLSDATNRARIAARLDPPFATTHVVLGDVLLESGNGAGALAEHQRALELDPAALADSRLDRRTQQYGQLGSGQAFAMALLAAVDKHPSRAGRLTYAYVLTRFGQMPLAIAQYNLLVTADPTDWFTWRSLALSYNQTGQAANAANAAREALSSVPADQRQTVQDQLGPLLTARVP